MNYKVKELRNDAQWLNGFFTRIEGLVNTFIHNYDTASDMEKYHAYKRLYDININSSDYLELLSKIKGTNYSKYGMLKTFFEGYVEDNNESKVRLCYECAVKEDFQESCKRYTEEEIKALADAKVVVPVQEDYYWIQNLSMDRKRKKYNIDLFCNYLAKPDYLSELSASPECYEVVVKYLEEKIGVMRACIDIKKLVFAFYCAVENYKKQLEGVENPAAQYNYNMLDYLSSKTLELVNFK